MRLSAVVNTWNEEANITPCLRSAVPFVDEIIIVDMHSTDTTVELARKFTTKIFKHEQTHYVEPARNFAIDKATGEWILLLDADEVIPEELGLKLRRLAEHADYTYYRLPRKNLIFGKWIEHSGWWPDYQIRFFKKGAVTWGDEIHSLPITEGRGMDLPQEEKNALLHYHYTSIEQFVERLNRYTSQQAKELVEKGENFSYLNLVRKPVNEFLSRFFVWEGYKDGLHGFALSLLQAVSFLVVELKLWQANKFTSAELSLDQVGEEFAGAMKDFNYWYFTKKSEGVKGFSKIFFKTRAKTKL